MIYSVKDDGDWATYDPGPDFTYTMPSGIVVPFPPNTMFCKRTGDDVDWYVYSRNPANFAPGSVKISCLVRGGVVYTNVATFHEIMLFPQQQRLIEVHGYTGTDPQKDFARLIVNIGTGEFSPVPVKAVPVITLMADIWRRCSDPEAETLDGLLQALPTKKRKL